ncbi:uncharacterized protein LOC141822254 [Curcuma longa]|uniref:uncharacterized protein LOC141822254 n=1 Tax=Curcuma longa TaxID=136217 RepID=UPI003D9ED688
MERSAMDGISERLASLDGLYFPGAMHRETPDPAQRKSALLDLLSRDASIFLERYGAELTPEELLEFDKLKQDYEVEWHLDRLRRRRNPSAEDARARSVAVKNRRRAYMERLIKGGEYFSEDAMREREPYLHHEYLGKFQDPAGRSLSRPGERWSETLMRRCEEAMLVEKIRGEQQRLGVDEKEWVGGGGKEEEVSEEEEEDDDDEEDDDEEEEEEEEDMDVVDDMVTKEHKDVAFEEGESKSDSSKENVDDVEHDMVEVEKRFGELEDGKHKSTSPKAVNHNSSYGTTPSTVGCPFEQTLSAEEMQDQLDQFTLIMQQKFLAGEDSAHLDYTMIDNDERLDDHWFKEANYDAEEKYFEDD